MESLYTVSTQDLWLKSRAENVPFHMYYSWLEDQITQAYVVKLAAANAAAANEDVLDSYLPSNSAASRSRSNTTLNTAATRMQQQQPNIQPSANDQQDEQAANADATRTATDNDKPTNTNV